MLRRWASTCRNPARIVLRDGRNAAKTRSAHQALRVASRCSLDFAAAVLLLLLAPLCASAQGELLEALLPDLACSRRFRRGCAEARTAAQARAPADAAVAARCRSLRRPHHRRLLEHLRRQPVLPLRHAQLRRPVAGRVLQGVGCVCAPKPHLVEMPAAQPSLLEGRAHLVLLRRQKLVPLWHGQLRRALGRPLLQTRRRVRAQGRRLVALRANEQLRRRQR